MMRVQERADALAREMFVGGPVKDFEAVGRLQLVTLIHQGLYPDSKVLDVGCGCLRGGYWLIHFLEPGCYFGIEPNARMLQAGIDRILEPGLIEEKRPQFHTNENFDFSVFGTKFNFILARSIWTHASKEQVRVMLDSFLDSSEEEAAFLASYRRAGLLRRDYRGAEWVGRSHTSDVSGGVAHSLRWIRSECRGRGLSVTELPEGIYNRQVWLRIVRASRSPSDIP